LCLNWIAQFVAPIVAPIVARRRCLSQHFGWHWLHAEIIGWWDELLEPEKPGWWLGQALGKCLQETSIVVPRQAFAEEDEYLLVPGIGESPQPESLPSKETLNTYTDYHYFGQLLLENLQLKHVKRQRNICSCFSVEMTRNFRIAVDQVESIESEIPWECPREFPIRWFDVTFPIVWAVCFKNAKMNAAKSFWTLLGRLHFTP